MANKVVYEFIGRNQFSQAAKKIRQDARRIRHAMKRMARSVIAGSANMLSSLNKSALGFNRVALSAKRAALSIKNSMVSGVHNVTNKMGIALAAATYGVIQSGSKFQDAMADMSSITGATGKKFEYYRKASMDLAKQYIIDQSEVAGAFKLVASAKSQLLADPAALRKVTEETLLLKNATGMELADATDVLMSSLNQYGAGADKAREYVDILAAGSKIGASEVKDTGQAIVIAAQQAKMSGLSFVQLNASLQVLAQNGKKGALAGTAMRAMLNKLEIKGIKKFMPSVVGLSGALKNLREAHLDSKQLAKLFGEEYGSVANILIQNNKLIDEWTKSMGESGVAQEQARVRMATFSQQAKKTWISVKDKLIKVFDHLQPSLTAAAQAIGKWIESISDEDIRQFSDTVITMGKGMASVAGYIKTIFVEVGGFIGETAGKIHSIIEDLNSSKFGEWVGAFGGSAAHSLFGNQPDLNVSPQNQAMEHAKQLRMREERLQSNIDLKISAPPGVVQGLSQHTKTSKIKNKIGVMMETY